MPVALGAGVLEIDLRQVVPDPQEVAVAERIQGRKNLAIGLFSGGVQRRALSDLCGMANDQAERAGLELRYRNTAEEHVRRAPIANPRLPA